MHQLERDRNVVLSCEKKRSNQTSATNITLYMEFNQFAFNWKQRFSFRCVKSIWPHGAFVGCSARESSPFQLNFESAFRVDLLCTFSPLIERNESLTDTKIVRSIKQTINNSFTQRIAFVQHIFVLKEKKKANSKRCKIFFDDYSAQSVHRNRLYLFCLRRFPSAFVFI